MYIKDIAHYLISIMSIMKKDSFHSEGFLTTEATLDVINLVFQQFPHHPPVLAIIRTHRGLVFHLVLALNEEKPITASITPMPWTLAQSKYAIKNFMN